MDSPYLVNIMPNLLKNVNFYKKLFGNFLTELSGNMYAEVIAKSMDMRVRLIQFYV